MKNFKFSKIISTGKDNIEGVRLVVTYHPCLNTI